MAEVAIFENRNITCTDEKNAPIYYCAECTFPFGL